MIPQSALPLASLLLIALTAFPARGIAAPKPEPANETLPESPAPVNPGVSYYGTLHAATAQSLPSVPGLYRQADFSPSSPLASTPCECQAELSRPKTVDFTLTTYSSNGNILTDVPRVPGAPNAPIGSAHWAPRRFYGPLVSGFKSSQKTMDQLFTGKLFTNVPTNLRSVLRLGSPFSR